MSLPSQRARVSGHGAQDARRKTVDIASTSSGHRAHLSTHLAVSSRSLEHIVEGGQVPPALGSFPHCFSLQSLSHLAPHQACWLLPTVPGSAREPLPHLCGPHCESPRRSSHNSLQLRLCRAEVIALAQEEAACCVFVSFKWFGR